MSRWLILGLGALLVGGGIAAGIYYGRDYFRKGPEELLKAGQESYARGEQAYQAGDAAAANLRFDEANLRASAALDDLEKERQTPKARTAEEGARLQELEGQAYWLRARALRDRAFAQALHDQKPIDEFTDASTAEKFRGVVQIPDSETRNEAITCVRQAAVRLPQSAEVQKEALRTELSLQPMQWDLVQLLARNVDQLNPKDARALYVLAREEYEQPATDRKGGVMASTPPEKRSRERMLKARDYLAQLKGVENYPLWRTLHLEALVDEWLIAHPGPKTTPAEQQKERQALRALLLDETDGAVARARRGERLTPLSTWDVQGVFGVHLMALDQVVADARAGDADADRVLEMLDTTLAFCAKMAGDDAPPLNLEEAASTAVAAAARAQPVLAAAPPARWPEDLASVQALARKALQQSVTRPALYADLARLLLNEAQVQANRDNKERPAELRRQARQWVEDGLRVGEAAKVPAADLASLHALAAEMQVLAGGKRESIAPHLEALKQAGRPQAQALAALLEGAAAEREGRLEKARQSLEEVLASSNPDLALRAHLVLANVYLGLGQPDRALTSLGAVAKAYERFEQLSPQEKAWALEFGRSPDDVTSLLVVANLEAARAKVARFVKRNPGEKLPYELVKSNEDAAKRLLAQIAPQTAQERAARQALVAYYAATGRRDQARKEVASLEKDYPASVDVLRLEVTLLAQPESPAAGAKSATNPAPAPDPSAVKAADARIQQFLTDNPRDVAARLLWAEWLTRTGRADKALTYLQDPANFPGGKDEVYNRVLAAALVGKGDRAQGAEVLQHLPHDPAVDVALIQVAATRAEQEKQVGEALARYEGNGVFRCWGAALNFDAGKYADAATGFARATEFTRVKPLAQDGLRRALLALAQQDPVKARDLTVQLRKETADNSTLLLCQAYASLLLDEVGSPGDAPDRVVTMASLLNAWEQAILKEGQDRVLGPLTKAQFWILANRPDLARDEVTRALKQNPEGEAALGLAIQLALDSYDPATVARARDYLATLQKVRPTEPRTLWLQAQVEERGGQDAKAIATYRQVLQKESPYVSSASAHLVALLEKQGDKQQARAVVQEWRKRLPDDVLAAKSEVRQLAADDQLAAARKAAEQFVDAQVKRAEEQAAATKASADVSPADVEKQKQERVEAVRTSTQLEMARAFSQGGAWDEGEAWARRLLEKHPDQEGALLLLGDVYLKREAWQQARDHYQQLLEKHPNNFIAANNLAWLLAVHYHDAPAAYRVAQEARKSRYSHELLPGDRLNEEFLDTLGVVYRGLDKPEVVADMRELFEAARRRYPNDPRMYFYLGCAYAGLQQPDKAEEMFTSAIALAGPQAKNALTSAQRQAVLQEAEQERKKLKGS
jgi:tetratricopeptide (TPR) repeat protein